MPRLDGPEDSLLQTPHDAAQRAKSAWAGFIDYIFSDNVLEVAIGLTIAAAFTAVVNSFTSDIILPIIALLPFLSRNFDQKFAVLKRPKGAEGAQYNTIKSALDDGAVVMAYGYATPGGRAGCVGRVCDRQTSDANLNQAPFLTK